MRNETERELANGNVLMNTNAENICELAYRPCQARLTRPGTSYRAGRFS